MMNEQDSDENTKNSADFRKNKENSIRSGNKYKGIIGNIKEGYFEVDLHGNYTFFNDALCEMMEYTREELIGMNYREFMTKEYAKKTFEVFHRVYMTEKTHTSFKYEIKSKSGKILYGESSVYLRYNEKGEKIGFSGLVRDITEKIEAEEKLRESEHKYKHLFETSPYSIMLLNLKGFIVDCNSTTEKLLGYTKSELIGTQRFQLTVGSKNRLEFLRESLKKLLQGKDPGPDIHQLRKKDGALIWVRSLTSMMHIKDNKLIQIISEDITEKKKAQELIKEENRKLKKLDKIRNNIIANVSHELKTPLSLIMGGTELLLVEQNKWSSQERKKIFKTIKKGGKRLDILINRLLEISRIENNTMFLTKDPTDLVDLINDLLSDLKIVFREVRINITKELPSSLILSIDKFRIEQVFLNLLMNAIKNTPPSGKVWINLNKSDEFAEIIIKDNGVGLTADELNYLFSKFCKFERDTQKYKYLDIRGSGLGLYISKKIVKLHNGKLFAKSKGRGKGSTFILRLPL